MTLTTINVWPRLGTTVTLESGYVITAAGAQALATDEILTLLRKFKLLTYDPTGLNPNPSPIPGGGGSGGSGLAASSAAALSAIFGSTNGIVATLTAHSVSGDCGGGQCVWAAGDTTTVDNAMVFGNPSIPGRWLRLFEKDYINVRWFGARGDGVTNDSAAIQAALDYAFTSQVFEVFFPAGMYQIGNAIEMKRCIRLRGAGRWCTTLRAISGLASGANNCVIKYPAANGIVHNTSIEDLTIDGGHLPAFDPEVHVADNLQKHGIFIEENCVTFSSFFRRLNLWNTSGCGFESYKGTQFQNLWEDIDTNFTAEGGICMYGSFSSPFNRLTLGATARDRFAVVIHAGTPTFNNCNGLFGTYPMKPPGYYCPGVGWGKFGNQGLGLCRPTFNDCNFEKFQRYGLHFTQASFGEFNGGYVVMDVPEGRKVRFAYYEGVDGSQYAPQMSASTNVFASAAYGNPDTGVSDGLPIECYNGTPIGSRNTVASSFYGTLAGGETLGINITHESAGFAQAKQVVSRLGAGALFHASKTVSATQVINVTDKEDTYFVDTTTGNITLGLPQANLMGGRKLTFIKTSSDVNFVYIDANGGELINGAANYPLATQWEKVTVQGNGVGWVVVG